MLSCGLVWCLSLAASEPAVEVAVLSAEHQPCGSVLNTGRPRLSWVLVPADRQAPFENVKQKAYQIRAASCKKALDRSGPARFESAVIDSAQSLSVPWPGPELSSREQVWWQVRVWTGGDRQPTTWSAPSCFETGLLRPEDWRATWINDGRQTPADPAAQFEDDPAPLFRAEFDLAEQPVRARLYIVGLGYYEARVNGKRVSAPLSPPWTSYAERVLYQTYAVERRLRAGRNCLAVALGNGWYNPLPMTGWGDPNRNLRDHLTVGRPRLLAQLEVTYQSGRRQTIVSDPRWRVGPGPWLRNDIYLGEVYDARREPRGWAEVGFDDSGWPAAAPATEPSGELHADQIPGIWWFADLEAKVVRQVRPGTWLYDVGQNHTGQPVVSTDAPAGVRLTLRYGDLLHPDGSLNTLTTVYGQLKRPGMGGPGAPDIAEQRDVYITRGGGPETYQPRFTWHGFRWVEIASEPPLAAPPSVVPRSLSTEVSINGRFNSSDATLNRLADVCDRTFRSNLMSVQSDCPGRERFGWTGDIVCSGEAFMAKYDMAQFYAKTVRDMGDAQRPDGMLTDTAPDVGLLVCGVTFGAAHCWLLEQMVRYYGETDLLAEQYDVSRRWLELLTTRYPDHLVRDSLADHEGLDPLDSAAYATPYYYRSARIMARLAGRLGRTDDVTRWTALAESIGAAWRQAYVGADGVVAPGTQSAQAIALGCDILQPEQRPAATAKLLALLREQRHLRTGIFGTAALWDVVSTQPGGAALLLDLVRDPQPTGYGYMLAQGATTLWEHWEGSDNTYSQNHPMFGSVLAWMYHHLAGLAVAPDAVGSDRLICAPQLGCGLERVAATFEAFPRGDLGSEWRRTPTGWHWKLEVPGNTRAELRLPPLGKVRVNGQARGQTTASGWHDELGSGTWTIEVTRGE